MSRYTRTGWQRTDVPALVRQLSPDVRGYRKQVGAGCTLNVFVGTEDGVWHLSIAHYPSEGPNARLPTWEEIRDARYEFCPPELVMAILLPPRSEYVNAHETTMHLWQAG